MIPAQNIERIEIVKGGGSVLYGSEAVDGVVNIIMKKQATNEVSMGVAILVNKIIPSVQEMIFLASIIPLTVGVNRMVSAIVRLHLKPLMVLLGQICTM